MIGRIARGALVALAALALVPACAAAHATIIATTPADTMLLPH